MNTQYAEHLCSLALDASGIELTPIDGGFHIKPAATPGLCIDVMRMLFNWRIVRSDDMHAFGYDRGWCYAGTGLDTFLRAVGEAAAWDGADDTSPEGWIKELRIY